MAQQARPKVAGHSEDLRVQLTSFSTLASRMPLGSFSSRPMSVPVQSAAPPYVCVCETDRRYEQGDLDQTEQSERIRGHREGVEKDHFDVEQDKQHRGQVVG